MRRISRDLRPSLLDDLGLIAAARWLIGQTARWSGLEIRWQGPERDSDSLSKAIETTFYRILQEALTNIARHAGARHVDVRFELLADSARLSVNDDGCGFDTDLLSRSPGLGLLGMRERVELLHGHWFLETAPGTGCRLQAELPLESRFHGDNHSGG